MENQIAFANTWQADKVEKLLGKLNVSVQVEESTPVLDVYIVDSRSFNTFAYVEGVESVREYNILIRDSSINRHDSEGSITLTRKTNRARDRGARYHRLILTTKEGVDEIFAARRRARRIYR